MKASNLHSFSQLSKPLAVILIFMAIICSTSCAIYYTSGFTFTDGNAIPCPPTYGWCMIEVPNVGYVGVNAYPQKGNITHVNIRMAPNKGVTARWASDKITVVDLSTMKAEQKSVFNIKPLVGGDPRGEHTGNLLIGYGPYIESHIIMDPIIRHVELRFPSLIVDEKEISVPPVRYSEKLRIPVPGPAYIEHW